MAIAETRRKFDQDFRDGVVRVVRQADKPIAQVDVLTRSVALWVKDAMGR